MARPIVMPSVGMFTAEGTLSTWLKPHGSRVEAGEPVAEVTTEKANQEVSAPESGIIYHAVAIGANLVVQGLMGYILAEGEAPPATAPAAPAAPAASAPATASSVAPSQAVPSGVPAGEIRATPIARRLAADSQIDLTTLTGTGPGGRIVEADVVAAVARRDTAPAVPAAPTPAAGHRVRERIPLVGIRKTIADRLRSSQSTVAAVTVTREIDAEALVGARKGLGARLDLTVPYDALFVKILASALGDHPELNATIEGDAILVLDDVNVGFAVAVPGALLVPVVHDAAGRSLREVAIAVRELSERAKSASLKPTDVGGGTITITNLGAYHVDAFTPIINPPQSAILGIGRILARPAVRDGQLIVRQTCVLSLTFDHRVIDGAPAARLLDRVARLMNDEVYLNGLG